MTPNNPENQTQIDAGQSEREQQQRLAEAAAEIRRLSALVDELLEERDNCRWAIPLETLRAAARALEGVADDRYAALSASLRAFLPTEAQP